MHRIHVCTGLLERDGAVLLVGNTYPNQPRMLWGLPGGRQEWGETAEQTVVRELCEETGLAAEIVDFAYVAESFDHATTTHVTSLCFRIRAAGEPQVPHDDAHVREVRFVPRAELEATLHVRVIREPLLAYLAEGRRYSGYLDAGITIAFAAPPPAAAATVRDATGKAPRPRDDRG
jgi:ADP-ribose pyrophosphatase YjhB (NUDIX family)